MKINLKNGEAMSFTKKFPMNIFEIRDTLDRLKIPDDKPIVRFEISEHDNMEFPFALCLRDFSADIYRLNRRQKAAQGRDSRTFAAAI